MGGEADGDPDDVLRRGAFGGGSPRPPQRRAAELERASIVRPEPDYDEMFVDFQCLLLAHPQVRDRPAAAARD